MHDIGFVHRDLKPENILVSFNPLSVAVIDFNRSYRLENVSEAVMRGTPGYVPMRYKWTNGSKQWDIWSLASIILECDLKVDAYENVKSENKIQELAKEHKRHE